MIIQHIHSAGTMSTESPTKNEVHLNNYNKVDKMGRDYTDSVARVGSC